jgi:hypothetical protein
MKDICRRILGNQLTNRTILEPRLPVANKRLYTVITVSVSFFCAAGFKRFVNLFYTV